MSKIQVLLDAIENLNKSNAHQVNSYTVTFNKANCDNLNIDLSEKKGIVITLQIVGQDDRDD